ncbi:unnamed protein product [Vitrella brassicaformis CCMP3155]|uniref:Uncharacterized protein n=1 Tax=Vitrella brassicaformis (strain CCMP3155) TaxID=1169540 RepID=A0A0G4G997_VITBC|nr:unnamed protein product [Vitrella brassicaformis CCMP3155]|eukprot:CEM25450.1 unnamed protein product [Vitrella brassicaformis CCMP3155]
MCAGAILVLELSFLHTAVVDAGGSTFVPPFCSGVRRAEAARRGIESVSRAPHVQLYSTGDAPTPANGETQSTEDTPIVADDRVEYLDSFLHSPLPPSAEEVKIQAAYRRYFDELDRADAACLNEVKRERRKWPWNPNSMVVLHLQLKRKRHRLQRLKEKAIPSKSKKVVALDCESMLSGSKNQALYRITLISLSTPTST